MASSSVGLWASLNREEVPISPNRRANVQLQAAVKLFRRVDDLLPRISRLRARVLATRNSLNVHARDFQIYKAALQKVSEEAAALTGTPDLYLDCVRIEGKRAALFPLYKASAENHALLKLSLENDEAELKILETLLDRVHENLGYFIESLKKHYEVFGPISTDFAEGAVFLCCISKVIKVDIPLFWSLRNEIAQVARQYGRELVIIDEDAL